MEGHFARDNVCDPVQAAAFHNMLRQQVAQGTAGAGSATATPPTGAQQITFVQPKPTDGSG